MTTWFVRKTPPQVTGPVGIFQLTGEVSEAGPSYLLQFAAFLSLNLGLINLFPLPAHQWALHRRSSNTDAPVDLPDVLVHRDIHGAPGG